MSILGVWSCPHSATCWRQCDCGQEIVLWGWWRSNLHRFIIAFILSQLGCVWESHGRAWRDLETMIISCLLPEPRQTLHQVPENLWVTLGRVGSTDGTGSRGSLTGRWISSPALIPVSICLIRQGCVGLPAVPIIENQGRGWLIFI